MDLTLLHPKIVHLPIALAVLLPLVSGGVLLGWWRGFFQARVWWVVVTLQLALAFVTACSAGGDLGSCPNDADVEIAAGEQVLERRCNSCHNFASDRVGGQAQQLYDTVADGSMPPSGELSSVEAEQLRVFLVCASEGGATAR
jgi:mono/diheme cytochrome c family protein